MTSDILGIFVGAAVVLFLSGIIATIVVYHYSGSASRKQCAVPIILFFLSAIASIVSVCIQLGAR